MAVTLIKYGSTVFILRKKKKTEDSNAESFCNRKFNRAHDNDGK